jgi:hypothetical protein
LKAGDFGEDFLPFDRTGAGDHHQIAAAHLHAVDVDHRLFAVPFAAGQFERFQHGDGLFDARYRQQRLHPKLVFVPDHADDGALSSLADVRGEPERLDAFNNMVDLGRGSIRLQHDDHAGCARKKNLGSREAGMDTSPAATGQCRYLLFITGAARKRT